jgi:hypothetical protein
LYLTMIHLVLLPNLLMMILLSPLLPTTHLFQKLVVFVRVPR